MKSAYLHNRCAEERAFCAWLTEERYLEVNPAKRLKLVGRQDASSREGLDDTQVSALLRQACTSRDSLRNYAIIQVLLQTGIRLDECSQLTLADLEVSERSGRITIRQGKGNRARVVPLNQGLTVFWLSSARAANATRGTKSEREEASIKQTRRRLVHPFPQDDQISIVLCT